MDDWKEDPETLAELESFLRTERDRIMILIRQFDGFSTTVSRSKGRHLREALELLDNHAQFVVGFEREVCDRLGRTKSPECLLMLRIFSRNFAESYQASPDAAVPVVETVSHGFGLKTLAKDFCFYHVCHTWIDKKRRNIMRSTTKNTRMSSRGGQRRTTKGTMTTLEKLEGLGT